ncbi:glycoside hydrolase family 78 protein [Actinomadura madurae]|uniref:glycoside hydrolase family 78 protein n=1 Tax=Actinomadura madurae TaxID=1993 RepID=UPI0020D24EB4|nr:hypothetical protein [Actinomadura madurae]MCQ0010640.1 hypothetical protein [Actinomadura madurae]
MSGGMSRRRFLGASAAGVTGAVVLGDAGPASAASPAASPARGRTPSGLLTSLLPAGLGVTAAGPRLSWQVADLGPGTRQTHYQVQFATTPARLERGPRLWDSGRVASARSVAVPYGGPALEPQTAYWWRVRTFDGHRSSRWSEPALLATGVGAWTAEPIWTPAAPPRATASSRPGCRSPRSRRACGSGRPGRAPTTSGNSARDRRAC